jgi:hypothetical protein
MAKRLSLSKNQRETDAGRELLTLLLSISEDGVIDRQEIVSLGKWLQRNQDADIPAIGFLADTVRRIVADKKVTPAELEELHDAIEKVLPPDARTLAVVARKATQPGPAGAAPAGDAESTGYCPYCRKVFPKAPKRGGECAACGSRYHVIGGEVMDAKAYSDYQTEKARLWRGGRLDAPSDNQLGLLFCLGADVPRGITAEGAHALIDELEPGGPTEAERQEYYRVRDEVADRIRSGEHIDDIISNPPKCRLRGGGAAKPSGGGCLGVVLAAAAGLMSWLLLVVS